MNYKLKEIDLDMGKKEYEMFQEIPAKVSGATNLCHGISFEIFNNYLEQLICNKFFKNQLLWNSKYNIYNVC